MPLFTLKDIDSALLDLSMGQNYSLDCLWLIVSAILLINSQYSYCVANPNEMRIIGNKK